LGGKLRKKFFFEKKNQKTFVPLSRRCRRGPRQLSQKFFASFLQKRRPSLLIRQSTRVRVIKVGADFVRMSNAFGIAGQRIVGSADARRWRIAFLALRRAQIPDEETGEENECAECQEK
jgi:hypothetical protein